MYYLKYEAITVTLSLLTRYWYFVQLQFKNTDIIILIQFKFTNRYTATPSHAMLSMHTTAGSRFHCSRSMLSMCSTTCSVKCSQYLLSIQQHVLHLLYNVLSISSACSQQHVFSLCRFSLLSLLPLVPVAPPFVYWSKPIGVLGPRH